MLQENHLVSYVKKCPEKQPIAFANTKPSQNLMMLDQTKSNITFSFLKKILRGMQRFQ